MNDLLHVLILEDSENDAILIAHELKRADFAIEWVMVDSAARFEEELQNKPDLILADYSLPNYDALRALSLLKETGLDIPFIVISGAITEETAVRCIKEGANDYLLKDRLARLGPAVQQALDETRLRKEKLLAEKALSESEAKYRSLFLESREGIFTTDLDSKITETNPAFGEMVGYSRDEIIGKRLPDLFADRSYQNRLTELRDIYGFARNIEIDILHKDGHIVHMLFTGSVMNDQEGQPQSFLGIARDITERKRGQREMELIVTVNAALRTAPNRKMMVPVVADIIQGISQAKGVAVVLKNPLSGELQVEAVTGEWSNYPDISFHIDEDVLAEFCERGSARHWETPIDVPGIQVSLPSEALGFLACVPLTTNTDHIGMVWFSCNEECSDETFRLVQVVGNITANAIHRTTLHENNVRSLQESEALANISRILNQNLNLETIFEQIVREAVHIIPEAFRSVIHLYDEKNERLHAVALGWTSDDEKIESRSLIDIQVSPNNEFDFGILDEKDIQAASMRLGKGVAGKVIETGKPMIVHDTEQDSRYLQTSSVIPIRSIVVSPILSGDLRLGTLSVLGQTADVFSQVDQNLVERLCTQASIAIENARLLEAERQQRDLAQAQAEISALLNQSLEINEVLAGIMNHTMRFFKANAVSVMLVAGDRLETARSIGYGEIENEINQFSIPLDNLEEKLPFMYQAYKNAKNVIVQDIQQEPLWNYEGNLDWIRSYVCIPLIANNTVIGLLNLDSDRTNAFGDLEMYQLESFANSAAAAVENARLYTELEQALATEKATRFQLIRADKLAGMGRMVASVAHELNNPLQTIKNCLFLIEQAFTDPEEVDLLELAMSEVERLTSIVNRLRDVYRPVANDEFIRTELTPMLADLEKLLETHLRRNRVNLHLDFEGSKDLHVYAFPDQLKQVFLNLSLNAIEAMQPDGGDLTIFLTRAPGGKDVQVSFSDTGAGIHEDELKRIFDPFYTTKETGMGLGLSICYDIVHNHNGSIQVQNNPDRGVTFTVSLPLVK